MINLSNFSTDCFDFHKAVIQNKRNPKTDPNFKNRLELLNEIIESLYNNYDLHFTNNELTLNLPYIFNEQSKTDLRSLYSYKSKHIQSLKNKITTTDTNRIIAMCQNCTINAVNSLDHILPKEEFAEFVVNPKNLFPSCTECNSYKGIYWHDSGRRLFLNLYLDILPSVEYLFVDIEFINNTFKTKFYLDNRNNIDPELYDLILTHYTRLHLCERFNSNVDIVITSMINNIKPYLGLVTIYEIVNSVLSTEILNKDSFGYNYWQSILRIALINDDNFLNHLNK